VTGDYSRQVGVRLRAVREARGMSLSQVQRASGGQFRAEALGSWERAFRAIPVERFSAYADWLGVDARLLLPEDWAPPETRCARNLGWPLTERGTP
jgi:transcriptional regulator with XRE-family HTH domain